MALGNGAQATGTSTTALGDQAKATATDATALGQNTVASAANSTATGFGAQATGAQSIASGNNAVASGVSATAMGDGTKATGDLATAQREYTKILRLSPGHPEVVRQLATLKASIQQTAEKLYTDGKQFFDLNDMDQAIRVWGRILELDPSNERAQKKIEEAKIKKNTLSGIFSKIS